MSTKPNQNVTSFFEQKRIKRGNAIGTLTVICVNIFSLSSGIRSLPLVITLIISILYLAAVCGIYYKDIIKFFKNSCKSIRFYCSIQSQLKNITSRIETLETDNSRLILNASIPKNQFQISFKGVEYNLRCCPAGQFQHEDEDGNQETKLIPSHFWILETPVTWKMWKSFYNQAPNGADIEEFPVDNVNRMKCKDFISKLNDLCAQTPKIEGWEFDLPTIDEWEYACRAGSTTKFNWGDNIDKSNANYKDSGIGGPSNVIRSKYNPNNWGIREMHGNVWEWTKDEIGNGQGLLMGGAWNSTAEECSYKYPRPISIDVEQDYNFLGFRLVLRKR